MKHVWLRHVPLILFFFQVDWGAWVNVHTRTCIPMHSHTFIQINIFSGVLPTCPNPKPLVERGANTFLGDAAEKSRNTHACALLGGEYVAGITTDWFARAK